MLDLKPLFNFSLAEKVLTNSSQKTKVEDKINLLNNRNLNQDQQQAIQAAVANEWTYIWGPPGTGKTHTLAVLIENYFSHRCYRWAWKSNLQTTIGTWL